MEQFSPEDLEEINAFEESLRAQKKVVTPKNPATKQSLSPLEAPVSTTIANIASTVTGDWSKGASGLVPGALSGLYGLASLGTEQLGLPLPGGADALEAASNSRKYWSDFGNYTVRDPENITEAAVAYGPTMLIPGGSINTGSKALDIGLGLITPLRQGKLSSIGGKVETVLPVAAAEALDPLVATIKDDEGNPLLPKGIPEYSSLALPEDVAATKAEEAQQQQQQQTAEFTPEELEELAAIEENDISNLPGGEANTEWTTGGVLGALAAAAAVGAGAKVAAKTILPLLKGRSGIPAPEDFAGQKEVVNVGSVSTDVKAGFSDMLTPMRDAAKKAGISADEVKQIEADIGTALQPHAMSSRVLTASYAGELPNSVRTIPNLAVQAQKAANLDPDRLQLLNNALSSADYLDTIAAFNRANPNNLVTSIPTADGSFTHTVGSLNRTVADAQADPVLRDIILNERLTYDGLRRYLQEQGAITLQQSAEWAQKFPNYAPRQIAKTSGDSLLKQASLALPDQERSRDLSDDVLEALIPRVDDPLKTVKPGEGLPPLLSKERYVQSAIRWVMENNAKRNYVDTMRRHSGDTFFKPVDASKKGGENVITFKRNGVSEYYRVNDNTLYNAMLFKPAKIVPIMNGMRQFYQSTLTGMLNPLFVPASLAYEVSTAPLLAMKGYGVGPLDEILLKLTNGKMSASKYLVDPTVLLSPVTGTTRHLYGAFLKEFSARLQASGATNGMFSRSLGALGIDASALGKVMENAYINSMHYAFNSRGGATTVAMDGGAEGLRSSMAELAPKIVLNHMRRMSGQDAGVLTKWHATNLSRGYSALMNAFHNSVKLQSFAANAHRYEGETAAQFAKRQSRNALHARRLTGDPTLTGDNQIARFFASTSPYANVAAQTLFQHARAIYDHPTRYALTLGAVGYATWGWLNSLQQADPEMMQKYWQLTPQQRASKGVPLYLDDTNNIVYFPLGQELRIVTGPMTELYGAVSGAVDPEGKARSRESNTLIGRALNDMFGNVDERDMEAINQSLGNVVLNQILPDPIGPGPGVILGALGMKPGDVVSSIIPGMEGRGITNAPSSRITPDEGTSVVGNTLTAQMEIILQEATGGIANSIINSINTWGRVVEGDTTPMQDAGAILQAAIDPYREQTRGRPEVLKLDAPTLGAREARMNLNDTVSTLVRNSNENVKKILEYSTRIQAGPATDLSVGAMRLESQDNAKLRGAMNVIASRTKAYQEEIQPYVQQLNRLREQYEDQEANRLMAFNLNAKRYNQNLLALKIREQNLMIYNRMEVAEDYISKQLGRPFRYRTFDVNDWKN